MIASSFVTNTIRYIEKPILKARYDKIPIMWYRDNLYISVWTHL